MNGLAALKPKTGVGHYVAHLHRHLKEQFRESNFSLYPGGELARILEHAQRRVSFKSRSSNSPSPRWKQIVQTGLTSVKHSAKIAVGIHFVHHCRASGYELYHEPNFIPFSTDLPTVVTVHDLSVLLHPEWHPIDRVKHHERHFAAAVRRAAHIIVVSEQVRSELIRETGVPVSKVTVVYNGVSQEFQPLPQNDIEACRKRLGLPPRYFLCVGTIEPRKNILTLMRAFADLPSHVRSVCPLVLVGPWGWKSDAELNFFNSTAQAAGVRHLGYVAAIDLPALYNGAVALLYPSFYEGFGLPPAEMLACGGAVVCSKEAAAVREIVGPYGVYLSAYDITAWRDTMRQLVDGGCSSTNGAFHTQRFRWDLAARETVVVYRMVLGLRSNQPANTCSLRRVA
jgi:alpha-1,3-rhamnosyl/mannosyltransferase